MKVIKRNGKSVSFNPRKIKNAIRKAGFVSDEDLNKIVDVINEQAERRESMTIEDIQDLVEFMLMKTGNEQVAREYIRYRKTRELIRQSEATNESILKLIDDKNEYLKTENSNKNHAVASTQRDYIAGEVSKDISMRLLLSKDIVDAHKKGAIHAHDLDYMLQHEFNCCLVDLENIFKSGTVINGTMIERPHSFATACNIATQIAAIIASNQYGGQTMSYSHLAPFVDVSRKRIRKELIDDLGDYIDVETLEKNVEKRVRDEVARGVQTIQYQILTLNSSNGQTPFITMFMYLGEAKNEQEKNDLAMIIEEVLKQRMRGVKNETGQWITPAFPKLIYVLEPSNITEDAPYWYLTELAAKCTSKRLVPDYISEKKMLEFKGACFPCMGCRSFLSPWRSQLTVKNNEVLDIVNGENATVSQLWANLTNDSEGTIEPTDIFVDHKIVSGKIKRHKVKSITKKGNTVTAELESDLIFYGRFNQGVATINLPFAALEAVREVTGSSDFVPQDIQSQKDVLIETFWKKLERYAELCHKVLQTRHARLLNTGVEISPLHWMHGGLARLSKHGNFNELLVGGYSTASLGYAGLYEAVYALIGQTHTSGEGKKFALQILQKLNDYCEKWKKRENIGYSLYGSPIESTTYKFAQANQREFGTIEEVTDHGYVTNSYHVNVRECIDPFTKLDLESEFQALSQGGCISYIETANLQNNIPAVLDVIKHIYDHIMYAELNCKSDYCQVCGSSDEIQIVDKGDGKLVWRCRHCGNEDQAKMNVTRRTCGYLGSNFWNQGRTEEIKDRYVHLGETETLEL